jgi:anthranilate phosphoribosyltransferase
VLEALGITITTAPDRARAILDAAGLVFLFAPTYHPAMRHLAPVRRELKVATIMNLVGPLANPAGVERQVLGVADPAQGPLLAAALAALGVQHALVVHADEGLDEVSPVGITRVWEVRVHDVSEWAIDPADHEVGAVALTDLAGGEPADNARILTAVLRDRARGAVREALALNAGAALYVAGKDWSLAESVERARASIDSGAAWEAVLKLRSATAE